MNVQKALKELRLHLRLSQEALARRLNLTLKTVSRYETVKAPSGKALVRFVELANQEKRPDLASVFEHALMDEFMRSAQVKQIPVAQFDRLADLIYKLSDEWESIEPAIREARTESERERLTELKGNIDAFLQEAKDIVYPFGGKGSSVSRSKRKSR